tara:strand:- start:201 stop:476 length:276 start_codon:yes stop_codon:yes gene_type:complete
MTKTITGKVQLKRGGSFKTFVYELNGEVLRKSHRYYPLGFKYFRDNGHHWTFGKAPNSIDSKRYRTEVFQVIWQESASEFLPEEARKEVGA